MSRYFKKYLFLFIIVAFFFLILTIVGENGLINLYRMKRNVSRIEKENSKLGKENIALTKEIERLIKDPVYIERIAREKYGFAREDEMIYELHQGGNPPLAPKPKSSLSHPNKE